MKETIKPSYANYNIGKTFFVQCCKLKPLFPNTKLFVKFEGSNPTGTQKDRAAFECLKVIKSLGYRSLAIGTCGNFGVSFAYLSKYFGIHTHVYLPQDYQTGRTEEIISFGGIVNRVHGTYEEAIQVASEEAKCKGLYNANPGEELNTQTAITGYANIAYEILSSLGYAPEVVSVPVGNGTTLAGIYHGFKILHEAGKIRKTPRMIAASTSLGNSIVNSFLSGHKKIKDLLPSEITETSINEPLVSWHSFDGQLALDALRKSDGSAFLVTDSEMLEYTDLLAKVQGLKVLPASASSIAALQMYLDYNQNRENPCSCVAVATAREQALSTI